MLYEFLAGLPNDLRYVRSKVSNIFGGQVRAPVGIIARVGLAAAGYFLASVGVWLWSIQQDFAKFVSLLLAGAGLCWMLLAAKKRLNLVQTNFLALVGHATALLIFYFVSTRFQNVVYATDSMIGTYMGIVKTLGLSNPYNYSIKPFLDMFGLPPANYTPRVDGSFEFHLNYPAFNFLPFVPLYALGLHDLRDGILIFHMLSLLVIFGVAPSRLKAISVAPFFYYFPATVAGSWTDSLWAMLVVLSAALWYRNRKTSFALVGLAIASKQIAVLALPFLFVRQWHESERPSVRNMVEMMATVLASFWIPNLPFFLSSPSAWWTSVASPYLPGSTPQVIGGIGLSDILTNLGFNPPYSLFFLLMGLAFTASLCAYARCFSRAKYLLWLLPAFVLFFYYRSFPNYFAYWAFPLILDLSRANVPTARLIRPLGSLERVRMPLGLPRLIHGRVGPSVLLGLVLTAALAGASGAYISRTSDYKILVHIDSVTDPDGLGLATLMKVTLANRGIETVTPQFFVKWAVQPFLWQNLNSTISLSHDTNGSFTIKAYDTLAAVPDMSQFRVWIFDSTTAQLVGQSPIMTIAMPKPGLVNPHLKWWVLDPATGKKAPYGWKVGVTNTDLDTSSLSLPGLNSTSGAKLVLNYTSTTLGQAEIQVSQTISSNSTLLDLSVLQGFQTETVAPEKAFFGAQISDGNHKLFILFSSLVSQQQSQTFQDNTTLTLPVEYSNWSRLKLDIGSLWTSQSWTLPKGLTLEFFIRAESPGVYSASLGDLKIQ